MKRRTKQSFNTIKCEGALIPPDFLLRIMASDADIEGIKPESYHLGPNEKINEAISRSWSRLLGLWKTFNLNREKLQEEDKGTSLTRERWMLPFFQELGYGRLTFTKAAVIESKEYPISHFWHHSPIHILGFRVDLDTRAKGVAGAARMSPHSMIQEYLNRDDDYLWAFLTNGLKLRILRDNMSLVRQSFIEFDIERMMDEEVYSDFALLWMLCHQSRVEAEKPEECWLEKWTKKAYEQGTRALDRLRNGVEEAIRSLGAGFIAHSANNILRDKLRSGELNTQDYYRQLLRTVYRMIFLLTAEDRDLLFAPDAKEKEKAVYNQYYSISTLRDIASRKRGTRHGDLWRRLNIVFKMLGEEKGCSELGIPVLGSFLWAADAVSGIIECELSNSYLLEAIRHLTLITDNEIRMTVNFKNLGSEELGSVYESLLELHPVIDMNAGKFELNVAPGHERKTTGSYYTPTSLINCLLDSALDPVLDEASKKKDAETSILDLKVCDPASGSGHFLIAASHRIAKRLASVRTNEYEPAPPAIRTALRDVIGHCIYGVDINPMSVELCKINLWMEAIEPGRPLSFLDHHIKCGNSLIGTTPALMAKGIPDEVFNPIEGDDKAYCSSYKRQNRAERAGGQGGLFDTGVKTKVNFENVNSSAGEINSMEDSSIDDIHKKEKAYKELVVSETYSKQKFIADSWCAAFFWKKTNDFKYPITHQIFRNIESKPDDTEDWLKNEVIRLSNQAQYFHWHIEFPRVFKTPDNKPENEQMGWNGGFDVVLGNPPYDVIREPNLFKMRIARGTRNLFSHFTEIAVYIIKSGGSLAFVVPLTIACGSKLEAVRKLLYKNFGELWCSHYSIRPSKLFDQVEQRITLLKLLKRYSTPCKIFSTRLHRWRKGDKNKVLFGAEYGLIGTLSEGLIPKVAGKIGSNIYNRIISQPQRIDSWVVKKNSSQMIYYHAIARYWVKAYAFMPFFQRQGEEVGYSTTLKSIFFGNKIDATRTLALLNSSLFYYWWLTQSDEFHVLLSEIMNFGLPENKYFLVYDNKLEDLVSNLMNSYRAQAIRKKIKLNGQVISYDEFYPRRCLKEIYAIDDVVAKIYELTDEENEFLKKYDQEFRTDEE